MTGRTRATALLAVPAAVGLALGGCGQEPLPQPRPAPSQESVPVVVDAQVESIRSQIAAVLESGDQAQDAEALGARLSGPALELRRARYGVARAVPEQPAPPALGGELLLDVAPAATPWPRFFLTATTPGDGPVPRLHVLTQAGPREPYKLSAWVTLLPGVTLPPVPEDEPPEPLPPAAASGLLADPADVLTWYSQVLDGGEPSEHADAFAPDQFREQVLAEQQAEREAVSEFFLYTVDHAPRPDAVWAVRADDGGAIVVGAMNAQRRFQITAPGARLPLPPDLAALAGATEATQLAVVNSVEIVAFHVPAEGSDDPITVLGGERGVLSASAS